MLHFTHAVDYYKFLVENFYNNAPYFINYENEGKLDVDYNTGDDIEEYINYQSECFEIDDDGSSYYRYEFFPPVHHVVENVELLRYLINDLVNKSLQPELKMINERIISAFEEKKLRKIKHEIRLIKEKTEDSIKVIEYMIDLGLYEKVDHTAFDFVVDNYIITGETMKEAYQKNVDEFIESVNINYLHTVSTL